MFKLSKIVGWRYLAPDGVSHLLTTQEAEAKFMHTEMYGRRRAAYLSPVWERASARPRVTPEVVAFGNRAFMWLAVGAATVAGWFALDCDGGFAATVLLRACQAY